MPPLSPIHFFYIFVIGQGLFLAAILFKSKRGIRGANKLLSLELILLSFYITTFFLYDSGYRYYIPILITNGFGITPLIPVIALLYLKKLNGEKLSRRHAVHLTPFLIQFLYWLPNNLNHLFYELPPSIFEQFYSPLIINTVSGIHIIIFLIYGLLIQKHVGRTPTQKANLQWIKKFQNAYSMIAIIFALGTMILWFYETDLVRYIFISSLAIYILIVSYYGYMNSSIIFNVSDPEKPKYFHSTISEQQSAALYNNLCALFNDQKPYLEHDLKLTDVASKLKTSPHHVSRAINENSGQNFFEFINNHRIEESKRILADAGKSHYKMIAVALDSGFSNKVSFYKNFKKITGQLPIEYRESKISLAKAS
ncbi:MAG: helix-turn-helix domain-containing protein [Cyclobacteriaceae bacterium]